MGMNKKRIFIMLLSVGAVSGTQSMERDTNPEEDAKKTNSVRPVFFHPQSTEPTLQRDKDSVLRVSRTSSEERIPMPPSPRLASSSPFPQGAHTILPPVDLKFLPESPRVGKNGERQKSVKNMKDLKRAVSNAQSAGRLISSDNPEKKILPTRVETEWASLQETEVPASPVPLRKVTTPPASARPTHSLLPTAMLQKLVPHAPAASLFTEEQVWAFLKRHAPDVHNFAIRNHCTLEELEQICDMIDNLDVEPQVLIELIQNKVNDDAPLSVGQRYFGNNSFANFVNALAGGNNVGNSFLMEKYGKIKEQNPEKYRQLVFEAVKAAADYAEGNQHRSALADTHVNLQSQKIREQDDTIRLQWAGLLAGLITTIGGWGISIWQFTSGNHTT
jgi:hypothetical protein